MIEYLSEIAKNRPIEFAEWVFRNRLFEYQKRFLLDDNRRVIMVTCRQAGKSTTTALKAIVNAVANDDFVILIVSRTMRQSRLLANRILDMIRKRKILESVVLKMNTEEIKFENGSVIYSLPGNPDSIRGFTANMVIVDEAAFVPDEVYAAIEPTLATTKGQMILISTPYRREGYFYRAWCSSGWSKHRLTCYENPLIDKEFIEQFRRQHTITEFKREMLAEFVDDESESFLTEGLVKNAMVLDKQEAPNHEEYDYVIGVDVARFGNDYTVFAIVGKRKDESLSDGTLEVVNYVMFGKKPLTYTIGRLVDVLKKWKPIGVVVDSNGLGAGVFDVMKEKLGSLVMDVNARGQVRTDMYMQVREMLMDGRLLLPKDDERIVSHFLNVDVMYSSNGNLRIVKKPNGNDDILDAIVYGVEGWRRIGYGTATVEVCDLNIIPGLNSHWW